MANRVVRAGILESDSVNKLTWPGEVFYRRLMSILDDYGRCDARPAILRTKLYPLRIDKVSEPDIVKWISECEKAGLVRKYHVDSKEYLEMFNFGQTVRIKKARVPPPPNDYSCKQMQADASTCSSETETETETTPLYLKKVSRESNPDDEFYDDGQQMFAHIQTDELQVEQLLRIVQRGGFSSCNAIVLMKAVRFFITREEAKTDFKYRTRKDLINNLTNWISRNAKILNQYG